MDEHFNKGLLKHLISDQRKHATEYAIIKSIINKVGAGFISIDPYRFTWLTERAYRIEHQGMLIGRIVIEGDKQLIHYRSRDEEDQDIIYTCSLSDPDALQNVADYITKAIANRSI